MERREYNRREADARPVRVQSTVQQGMRRRHSHLDSRNSFIHWSGVPASGRSPAGGHQNLNGQLPSELARSYGGLGDCEYRRDRNSPAGLRRLVTTFPTLACASSRRKLTTTPPTPRQTELRSRPIRGGGHQRVFVRVEGWVMLIFVTR